MASASDISRPVVLRSDCGLGQIDFVNCLPITHVLLGEKPERLSLIMGTPGDLNKQYRDKILHLGAMSSHYFLEDGGFQLFPDISISAKGAVGSVLFFSRRPLDQLKQSVGRAKIGVPTASASSVKLLQILLAEIYGLEPDFIALPEPRPDLSGALDAYLLFGDNALIVDQSMRQSGLISDFERIDMGQWWFETYGLPMVFGVWAARKHWAAANPEDFQALSAYLAGSHIKGLGQDLAVVVAEASQRTGLSTTRLRHYYQNELDYSFRDEHSEGLQLYYNLCKKHNLL